MAAGSLPALVSRPGVPGAFAIVVALALTLGGASVAFLASCEPDGKLDPQRQAVLRDLVSVVIIPTYDELSERSAELVAAAAALQADPNDATLSGARAAFRAAITPWKRAESFYFGPVDDIEVTGLTIDSRPADGERIDALVNGDGPVDPAAVRRLGANQRGFPGIEQLLFDSRVTDAEVLARFTDAASGGRRGMLLSSLGQDLSDKTRALREAWGEGEHGKGGYGHELGEAGVDSATFGRQRDGIDKVVTGMLYLTELMVVRFAKPLGVDGDGTVQPQLEDAARSDGTLDSFRDGLLGLRAVYLCRLGNERGVSLSDEVREDNPGADERFLQAIDDAVAAVAAVPGSFREALATDAAPIHEAHQKTRAVKAAIQMEIAGALGASIGFGYSDTD